MGAYYGYQVVNEENKINVTTKYEIHLLCLHSILCDESICPIVGKLHIRICIRKNI